MELRGYRYDTETGLYYLNSRYYSPEWNRFINADTLAGKPGELLSHNLFAYCGNNPVCNVDPSGKYYVDYYFYDTYCAKNYYSDDGELCYSGIYKYYNDDDKSIYAVLATAAAADDFTGVGIIDDLAAGALGGIVYLAKQSKKSARERSTKIPSWAKGNSPKPGQSGKEFAKELCDDRYGKGNYDTGPGSDYNQLKKFGDRGFN